MVKYIALKPMIINEKKVEVGKSIRAKEFSKRMLDVNIRLGRIGVVKENELELPKSDDQ